MSEIKQEWIYGIDKAVAKLAQCWRIESGCAADLKEIKTYLEAQLAALAQEPFEYQFRARPMSPGKGWTEWAKCSPESFTDYVVTPVLNDWLFETRVLYVAPQGEGA